MNIYQKLTESPEALADFLRRLQVLTAPWDEAFHRAYCDKCSAENCDGCAIPERNNPLWYLGLPADKLAT